MKIARIIVVWSAAGCVHDARPVDDGGQSGTAHPPFCVEDSVVQVVDPAVPADGFGFAAAEVLDSVAGTWHGVGVLEDGTELVADVVVAWDGQPIDAITSHLDPGDGLGEGPVFDCAPTYDIGFTLDLGASPLLEAAGGARVSVTELSGVELPVQVDVSEVGGALEPPEWDHPEYWDRTALSMVLSQREDTALDLQWWAINDDPEQTGTGGTVTVEPAGMNEPIVYLAALERVNP
ncbi:MAG: hypothetical protein ABMA64_24385 [Myxococcota bacterium]